MVGLIYLSINSNEYGNKFRIQLEIDHLSGYEFAVSGLIHYDDIVPAPKVYDFGSVTIKYTPES